MRTTLLLLSSLALAAAASAQSTATASSRTVVTYAAPTGVSVAAVPSNLAGKGVGQYDHGTPSFDDAGGTAILTPAPNPSGTPTPGDATSFSQTGNTITITSDTLTALDSSNYAAIGSPAYYDAFLGYRYFLQFTNTTATAQMISFAVNATQGGNLAAASPFGRADDLDGDLIPDTAGAFASNDEGGGLIDTTDPDNELAANENNSFETSGFQGTASYSTLGVIGADSLLKPGESRIYEIYASSESYTAFNPQAVPEPSAFAALGLSALGLLRRRARR